MIVYDNYSFEKNRNYVVFSASALSVVELVGTVEILETEPMPAQWNDALRAGIDFEKYNQYCICIHEKQHGFYNRLTDHRGIWKLTGLPYGIAEDSYEVNRGKVYWGVSEVPQTRNWYEISNVCILMPKEEVFPVEVVKQLWKENQIGFDVNPDEALFRTLLTAMPNSYLFYCTRGIDCRLEIFGTQVEKRFDAIDG